MGDRAVQREEFKLRNAKDKEKRGLTLDHTDQTALEKEMKDSMSEDKRQEWENEFGKT